ncbi:MAG: VWA domain-containing protein [Chloroflexota bacterium]
MDEENNEEDFALTLPLAGGCGCGIGLLAVGIIAGVIGFLIVPFMFQSAVTISGESGLVPAGMQVFRGESAADSDIDVLLNGEVVGSTTSDENGAWLIGVPTAAAGTYLATARYGGSSTVPTEGIEFQIPAALTASSDPTMADMSTDGGMTMVPFSWSGTGEPGTTIVIGAGGEPLGETSVDDNGGWTFSGDLNVTPGDYGIDAKMFSAEGVELDALSPIVVNIPAIGSDGLAYNLNITTVNVGDSSLDPVEIVGTAAPDSTVTISVPDFTLATLRANAGGDWNFSGFIPSGVDGLTASAVDTNGEVVLSSDPIEFTLEPLNLDFTNSSADTGLLRILFAAPSEDSADADFLAGSPAVELIVDASWSMTLPLDSNEEDDRLTADDPDSRIAIAKEALFDLIDNSLPTGSPVALRAFGNIEGDLSCRTDLMLPLQPANTEALRGIVDDIEPQFNANTAIAAALAEVSSDLTDTDRSKVVVLLTDGAETCDGDPGAEIENLVAQDIETRVNIIGFAIDDTELKAQFEAWAVSGNGEYFDAADSDTLVSALRRAMTVVYRINDAEGVEVETGIVGGGEIELEPGVYQVQLSSLQGRSFENVIITPGSAIELVVNR